MFEPDKEGIVFIDDVIDSHDNLNDNCRGKPDDDGHGSYRKRKLVYFFFGRIGGASARTGSRADT